MCNRVSTCMSVYIFMLPCQIIITDQQQVLHHGQEVVLGLGVLHCIDDYVKHFPHITEARIKVHLTKSSSVKFNRNTSACYIYNIFSQTE